MDILQHLSETATEAVVYSPLYLTTDDDVLSLGPKSPEAAIRFLSWFRWVILIVCVGFGLLRLREFAVANDLVARVFLVVFALLSCFVGFLGAFVALPLMSRLLRLMTGASTPQRFPQFDLRKRTVRLPDKQAFMSIREYRAVQLRPTDKSWLRAEIVAADGQVSFLVNYSRNDRHTAEQHLAEIAARTGILWNGFLDS